MTTQYDYDWFKAAYKQYIKEQSEDPIQNTVSYFFGDFTKYMIEVLKLARASLHFLTLTESFFDEQRNTTALYRNAKEYRKSVNELYEKIITYEGDIKLDDDFLLVQQGRAESIRAEMKEMINYFNLWNPEPESEQKKAFMTMYNLLRTDLRRLWRVGSKAGVMSEPIKDHAGALLESIEYLEEAKKGNTRFIKKKGDYWRIISAKTGKLWPQKYESRDKALAALNAYHASK